jgi:hypothetical protein
MSLVSHRRLPEGDRTWKVVALCAIIVSIAAFLITDHYGAVLTYNDSISHLQIARRVVDSTSPGAAQLGGVWLPLPHVLTLPFVWIDSWYYSGFAGSIVSMCANVVTIVLVYKITYKLANSKLAGVVAAIVFGVNINVLYMQSTPMTEALLFCLLAAVIYCIQQWADTNRSSYLLGAIITAILATLTRYEAWPILIALYFTVLLIARAQGKKVDINSKLRGRRTRDRFILFTAVGSFGVAGWMLWNQVIFGDFLNFQGGDYAKPSLWLTNTEPAIGNWWVSVKTYGIAMANNVSWPILALAACGLGLLLFRQFPRSRNNYRTLPVLSLLVIVPFFILSLYKGQRPLHVMETVGNLYNVRFGLIIVLPAAIFVGYLSTLFTRKLALVTGGILTAVALSVGVASAHSGNIATYQDPASNLKAQITANQMETATAFKRLYDGGLILEETFGNERLTFAAIPPAQLVYEGSFRKWEPALRYPAANHIRWIVTRCGSGPDKVCQAIKQYKFPEYEQVFTTSDGQYSIYRLDTNR